MKVYLAGKIKDDPNYREKFAAAAEELRKLGHNVFNPAAANQEGRPLGQIMAYLLPWLCTEAEAIAFLPDWKSSGGALVEFELANYLGKEIIWL